MFTFQLNCDIIKNTNIVNIIVNVLRITYTQRKKKFKYNEVECLRTKLILRLIAIQIQDSYCKLRITQFVYNVYFMKWWCVMTINHISYNPCIRI